MRRKFLALLAFALLSSGHSQISENLKDIQIRDLCPLKAFSSENGQENKDLTKELTSILNDQILAYNFVDNSNLAAKCAVGIYFDFQAGKLIDGIYVYAAKFKIFAVSGNIEIRGKLFDVQQPTIYEINSFGISSDSAKLKDAQIRFLKDTFQEFILAWRKSHK